MIVNLSLHHTHNTTKQVVDPRDYCLDRKIQERRIILKSDEMVLNTRFCKVVLPGTAYFEEPSSFSQQKGNFLPGFPAPSNFWQKCLSKKCSQFPPNIIIWKQFNSRLLHTSLRPRTKFLSSISSGN